MQYPQQNFIGKTYQGQGPAANMQPPTNGQAPQTLPAQPPTAQMQPNQLPYNASHWDQWRNPMWQQGGQGSAMPPGMPPPPASTQPGWGFTGNQPPLFNPQEQNSYGGQQIAGARPGQADYQSVQDFSDQALQQARRYLDPQQASQNRRLEQELINKGVDPNSDAGKEMASQLAMQQTDANNAASFGALQFGQGIQNQMNQQEQQRAQLAGQMQQGLWGAQGAAGGLGNQRYLGELGNMLGWRGQDIQQQLGLGGLANQWGQAMMGNQLGWGQLDMQQQGQDWNQMMGMMDWQRQGDWYDDNLFRSLLGGTGLGQGGPSSGMASGIYGSAAENQGMLGPLAGVAGSFFGMSDRRLKSNIRKIGEHKGNNWYEYDLFGRRQIGVMAQEVPWAAAVHPSGFLMVDYSKVI